uniref:Uncharacterized protein n=1 Tax=Anguilla anguilla TaxID=7936 RepID=A0A0E9R8B4_ANGAN
MCVYVCVCVNCVSTDPLASLPGSRPLGHSLLHNCLISHHSLLPSRGNPIHLVAFQNVMLFIFNGRILMAIFGTLPCIKTAKKSRAFSWFDINEYKWSV